MDVNVVFLLAAAIMAIGFFANCFFKKTKIPDVLWLVFFGFVVGPVLKVISPKTVTDFFRFFPLWL